ncbi:MAG: AAA domain-containing protein, partial [Rhizonema sp. PD38]|nr:AAA domain-containing protein [Rhizonema sp. PD38]
LTWFDAEKPKEKLTSPLLLIPIDLQKKGKKQQEYTINSIDKEISLNFLLVNKLKDEYNIILPESDNVQEWGYEKFIDVIRNAIAHKPDWQVEETAHITLFQETKAVMIQDLQQNEERIADHQILQGLALKKIHDNFNSPNLIKEKELDQIPLSSVYQICDADSSQQVVIEAAKTGLSCVVQGPPGTGKSQTIANIMAELIGKHKKVLLVAEKQTALEVVSRKFEECSLDDVCLNLHHQGTTNTKQLLEELNQTMSRLEQRQKSQSENRNIFFQQLSDRRQTLNQHVDSLHGNQPPLNKSAYDLYGELLKLEREKVPTLEFHLSKIQDWSEERLFKAQNLLEELGKFEKLFRGTETTLWSSSPVQSWSSDVGIDLRQNIENLNRGVQLAQRITTDLQELFGIQQLSNTATELDKLQPAIAHVLTVPLVPREWPLVNDDVNALRQIFIDLSSDISNLQNISSTLNDKYTSEFFTWSLPELRKLRESHRRYRGFFRWLRPQYRNNRKRLLGVRQVKHRVSDQELIADIENVIEQKNLLNKLAEPAHPARVSFDLLFDTEMPNLDGIEQALNWLEELQQYRPQLPFKGIAAVISSYQSFYELRTLQEDLKTSQTLIIQGFNFLQQHFPQDRRTASGTLEKTVLHEVKKFLETAKADLDLFQQSLYCQEQVRKLEDIGAKEFLFKLRESNILEKFWFLVLQKGVYDNWLTHILSDNPQLQHFRQNSHEDKIDEFSQLDAQQYQETIKRLQQLHAERWQEWFIQPKAKQQIQLLTKERAKKKGHQKIRAFIKQAAELVTTLKPCWLMSPLAVSQYVDLDAVKFDVIIFDEASQVRTEDAVPSIMRAEQVIVVGDDKQLPPTSFFKSIASDEDEEEQEAYDSLLNECLAFLPSHTLRWHYRSKDESLIAFSNQKFYNSELLTFPNPLKDASRGVHFRYVKDGIYAPGQQQRYNIVEAKEVAQLTLQHFQQNSAQSLGIIALNKQQSDAIREQLNQLIVKHSEIEEFCQENSEKFFIKPLELVQGDQRDVIFLSFGYGFYENDRERLYHFFGPLTKQGGRRRLNVAITRALYKFVLVASIKAEHFQPEGKLEEVAFLRDYFAYAQSCGEKLPDKLDDVSSDLLFEEDVYQALTERGYTVKKRVGHSAYPIDLAVVDNRRTETEEFLLGIVCDGTIYEKYSTARDRDRLRQKVLQDLGWRIHRIWSSEWFRDRKAQIKRLVDLIEHLRNQE